MNLFKLQHENCICGMFTVYKFIAEVLNLFYAAQPDTDTFPEILNTEIIKLGVIGETEDF